MLQVRAHIPFFVAEFASVVVVASVHSKVRRMILIADQVMMHIGCVFGNSLIKDTGTS